MQRTDASKARLLPSRTGGFSYVEALAALALTAMLLVVLTRSVGNVLEVRASAGATHDALEETRYALERMTRSVARSRRVLIPQIENPATSQSESVRDPGVLGLLLDPTRDLDGDGVVDVDNDGDGRIDEDLPGDTNYDDAAGIYLIDDNNDGVVDAAGGKWDDDESGVIDEDPINGVDDDGDLVVDDDPSWDMNGDGWAGIVGFDDDGDGSVDEGNWGSDDEEGAADEDWLDTVVFYQSGADLIERMPVPWDESGAPGITGLDFVERTLASNVTVFRVEHIPAPSGGLPLVTILLTRVDARGEPVSLSATTLAGAGL